MLSPNFFPPTNNLKKVINMEGNVTVFPDGLKRYILQGWVPPTPIIEPNARFLAVGSCFAERIRNFIAEKKHRPIEEYRESNLYIFGDKFLSTHNMRYEFEWAVGMREYGTQYDEHPKDIDVRMPMAIWRRHKMNDNALKKDGSIKFVNNEYIRSQSRKLIENTDVFVLTMGLSEIWRDIDTNMSLIEKPNDTTKAQFEVTTVQENKANIFAIKDAIRSVNKNAIFVWTLSPVPLPLLATFRNVSCITASEVSKAILRVAIDEFIRETDDKQQYYFPSYEIIRFWGPSAYHMAEWSNGSKGTDFRHINTTAVDTIMNLFWEAFVKPQ